MSELTELCESIVRNAMPATESGQTCFVPRYQLDELSALLAKHQDTPPAAEVDYAVAYDAAKETGVDYNQFCRALREYHALHPFQQASGENGNG